jgi:hypothetical protein
MGLVFFEQCARRSEFSGSCLLANSGSALSTPSHFLSCSSFLPHPGAVLFTVGGGKPGEGARVVWPWPPSIGAGGGELAREVLLYGSHRDFPRATVPERFQLSCTQKAVKAGRTEREQARRFARPHDERWRLSAGSFAEAGRCLTHKSPPAAPGGALAHVRRSTAPVAARYLVPVVSGFVGAGSGVGISARTTYVDIVRLVMQARV